MRLGVNVDHIATVRQARRGSSPDPVDAALVCERAGARSIVCHLREDRRHIQDEDVRRLKRMITTRLNLEMSIAKEIVSFALAVKPFQVTLVPERRQELTTEGGLDTVKLARRLRRVIEPFTTEGIKVSLFVDPVLEHLEAARDAGATIIELHTGRFANATGSLARQRALGALQTAARKGKELGLAVAAGHGLDERNVGPIVRMPEVEEVNIGFSIVARALSVGLERAVLEMIAQLQSQERHAVSAVRAT